MRRRIAVLLLFTALTACNEKSSAPTPPPIPAPAPLSQWTISFSEGTPPTMTKVGTDYTTPIPLAPGSIHYVTANPPPMAGKIVLSFEIQGTGTVIPKPTTDNPPAKIKLFLWRKGDPMTGQGPYEFYRWWSVASLDITQPGGYQLTAPLDPAQWTSVFGRSGTDPLAGNYFAQALSDLAAVGFTFGGASFAGHGDQSSGSQMTFVLHSYEVKP